MYTITDSRAHFSAFLHSDAHVTQSAHFSTSTVPRCEWKSQSIKSSDADLPSLCATDHDFRHHDLTFSVHCWYLVGELGQSPLHTNMRWVFGCVTPNATSTSYEPNVPTPTPIWIRTEQHVIQWWIWHMTMSTRNQSCLAFRCNFPQMSLSPLNNSAVVMFSPTRRGHVRNIHKSSSDTESKKIESLALTERNYIHSKCTCSSWTSRSGSNCYTTSFRSPAWSSTCLSTINKQNFLLPLINMKRLRSKNLVNILASNHEIHNYNVQMQIRQVEQEADVRCSQRREDMLS